MYIAINKLDSNEYHSFEWTIDDKLIINGNVVDSNEWDIVEVEIVERSSGYWMVGEYGVVDGPFNSLKDI